MVGAKPIVFRWYGDRIVGEIRAEMRQRLSECGDVLLDKTRQNISIPYPPASLPQQFPHYRSGDVSNSLFVRLHPKLLQVSLFSHSRVARYLEEGTVGMAPRPFMRRTFYELLKIFKNFLARPFRQRTPKGQFKYRYLSGGIREV